MTSRVHDVVFLLEELLNHQTLVGLSPVVHPISRVYGVVYLLEEFLHHLTLVDLSPPVVHSGSGVHDVVYLLEELSIIRRLSACPHQSYIRAVASMMLCILHTEPSTLSLPYTSAIGSGNSPREMGHDVRNNVPKRPLKFLIVTRFAVCYQLR